MDILARKLRDAQKQEEKAIKDRQKIEAEIIAKKFYKKGWEERGKHEDQKKAREAAKTLSEHKKKYHSNNNK